jgi:predicted nuclease with TOPRIM domain
MVEQVDPSIFFKDMKNKLVGDALKKLSTRKSASKKMSSREEEEKKLKEIEQEV